MMLTFQKSTGAKAPLLLNAALGRNVSGSKENRRGWMGWKEVTEQNKEKQNTGYQVLTGNKHSQETRSIWQSLLSFLLSRASQIVRVELQKRAESRSCYFMCHMILTKGVHTCTLLPTIHTRACNTRRTGSTSTAYRIIKCPSFFKWINHTLNRYLYTFLYILSSVHRDSEGELYILC